MRLPGTPGQIGKRDNVFRADGAIASGSAPQLVLPEQWQRAMFLFQNLHASASMFLEFGSARAHATLSSGGVSSVTIDNAGFNFTKPPLVEFLGGYGANSAAIGSKDPFCPAPSHPAAGHATLSGGSVASIVIDDPGAGYLTAPYVRITNNPLDFQGCADPSAGGGTGILLIAGATLTFENTVCPTDPVAVFCSTISAPFACVYI